jgi:amidophosphoribosyltransferase
LLAFRDPNGIRPLIIGRLDTLEGPEWIVASESVAIEAMGYQVVRDVSPGEAVLVDSRGELFSRVCAQTTRFTPCIFEFVYFARPDSVMDGTSIYESRLRMGEFLAEKIRRDFGHLKIDVVVPIPDTSRPSALQLAFKLGLDYREGFIKNRYIGRTFIMPGQASRKKSVRQKLNAMPLEFKGKNVLLVDDSIVRGTTSREIIQMARDAGATAVYFASASPPVRFPNVYGIDMPTRDELLANGRTDAEIAQEIGADAVIYQDLPDLIAAVKSVNPDIVEFDASCFDGCYVTGDVTEAYLARLEGQRNGDIPMTPAPATRQLDLNLAAS